MSAEDEGFTDMWVLPNSSGPVTRPRATVTSGAAPLTSTVDQRVDLSSNKALPWSVLGASFGFLGFGMALALCLLRPWETSDRAIKAEMRADRAQEIADIRAEAKGAAIVSDTWRNRVNKLEAEANANRRR